MSSASLVEGLGVEHTHSLQVVGHVPKKKNCGIDVMVVVLEELGKSAHVLVVVLEEGYRPLHLQ